MPPWAAPVWERVGYSLVRTAALTPDRASSSAAHRPAPPAPTMTAWYSWVAMERLSSDVLAHGTPGLGWRVATTMVPRTNRIAVSR